MTATYPIGTQFRQGRHATLCTVTDIWTTRNAAGEVVKTRYVATHLFCGQVVTDRDVVAVTIAKGLVQPPAAKAAAAASVGA